MKTKVKIVIGLIIVSISLIVGALWGIGWGLPLLGWGIMLVLMRASILRTAWSGLFMSGILLGIWTMMWAMNGVHSDPMMQAFNIGPTRSELNQAILGLWGMIAMCGLLIYFDYKLHPKDFD